ncbi:MAG TPA: response regulator, partial [Chroococcidiopsis sp.]
PSTAPGESPLEQLSSSKPASGKFSERSSEQSSEQSPERSPERSPEQPQKQPSERSPQHDAVQRVLERFRYSFSAQVDVLVRASAAIAAQQIDPALYDEAKQEAHKLAGSMATFGYPNGSQLSRSIEHLLLEGIPTTLADIARLSELVSALQQELPHPPSATATAIPETVATQPSERSQLVLLVSGDAGLAQSLHNGLRSLSLELAIASDWGMARSQLAAAQPAAVVVDWGESGCDQDGLQCWQDLSQRWPALPVIVVTQGDSFELRLVASRLGARQFLPKQASVEPIVRAIARVLPPPAMPTARVLIVDDDAASLAYLSALLVPWGLEVVTLDKPQQFWQVLTETLPQLIILDLEMPQISGLELCQVVRQDAQWGDLPLLVVTAHTDTDALQQAFAAGADDFISKPVIGPELVTRVLSRIERPRRPSVPFATAASLRPGDSMTHTSDRSQTQSQSQSQSQSRSQSHRAEGYL